MADMHRKIELQQQEDLCYLVNNAQSRAMEKIDLALPSIEGEDTLRRRVEKLVHEYITTTYITASENIVINGLPPSPTLLPRLLDPSSPSAPPSPAYPSDEYEPLDSQLHARAAELYRQEEDLLEEIAALKRDVPRQAAAHWKDALKEGVVRDEEEMRKASRALDGRDVGLGVEQRDRQVEVERTWAVAVEGLARLKREMPATMARMERAKRAADYVLAEAKGDIKV